jgi:D-3-phosphoglycerate dehydrogenase
LKILVTPTSFNKSSAVMDRLRAFAGEIVFNETGKPLSGRLLMELVKDCDGYIAGLDYITAEVIESGKKLKVISRYGVGYDRVDLDAAAKKNIVVTNTPGSNSNAVADLTMGLILSVARTIPHLDRTVRNGEWVSSKGVEIYQKTIGIIGLGAIGKAVAKRAGGFDMNILAYDPYMDTDYAERHHIKPVAFEELIQKSNIITLHLPLNEETRHIIDEETIARMQKGTIIVNTSRGGIVDEDAVCAALRSGKLGGLGLDVFEEEPPDVSKFLSFSNVVLTPHKGSHTVEATDNMMRRAVDNLIKVLSGEECDYIVK